MPDYSAGPANEKQKRVFELVLNGKSISEALVEVGVRGGGSSDSYYRMVNAWRKSGLLPTVNEPVVPAATEEKMAVWDEDGVLRRIAEVHETAMGRKAKVVASRDGEQRTVRETDLKVALSALELYGRAKGMFKDVIKTENELASLSEEELVKRVKSLEKATGLKGGPDRKGQNPSGARPPEAGKPLALVPSDAEADGVPSCGGELRGEDVHGGEPAGEDAIGLP